MRVRAYAKINLGLEVLSRRADDYHELRTILQTIDLYDSIRLSDVRPESSSRRRISSCPPGRENLVYRAATLLAESGWSVARSFHSASQTESPAGRGLGGEVPMRR